jgi:hypothetical protein
LVSHLYLYPAIPLIPKDQGGGGGDLSCRRIPIAFPVANIKINGTQCGSPALRRNHFCFFHKRWQETRIVLNANRARRARVALDLPVLEDANSVQVSLMQVMRLILTGQVDPKTAGLLLYALQTASSNLSRINFEPAVKTRVVIDPRTVDQTPLGEDPWSEEDFEEEEDLGEDQEASAEETIANIEGRAEAGQEHEQTIAQIQAVAAPASRPQRCVAAHPYRGRAVKDSGAVRGRMRAGRSHFAGTTSTGPVSWPPPIPLSSEWTCDGRS